LGKHSTARPIKASEGVIATTQEAHHTDYEFFISKASQ